ncbi:MAG: type II CAAX endopeptidase family protein [Bacteroidota bacterium]
MFFQNVYKGRHEFWTYLLTIIVVSVAYLLGGIVFGVVLVGYGIGNGFDEGAIMSALEKMDFEQIGIDANLGLAILLMVFVVTFLALRLMMRLVHQRPFRSLITSHARLNWSKIGFGFGSWLLLSLVSEGAFLFLDPDNYQFQFELRRFLPLLAIAIFLIPIQSSIEELLFRGYLMQGLGQISGERLMPLIVTSVLFGAMHLANPEVEKFGLWIMMPYYIGMGLLLGIITVMDESLELALGIHAANNIFGVTMVSFEGSALQTPALFRASEVNMEWMVPLFVVYASIITFVCAKKYGWTDWGKLFRRIEMPEETEEQAEQMA